MESSDNNSNESSNTEKPENGPGESGSPESSVESNPE